MDLQLRARLTGRRTLSGGCCEKKAFALAAAALLVYEHRLEFAAKAAGIVGLYPSPPENAPVISVDEKPSIQALESATGYVETDSGKIVALPLAKSRSKRLTAQKNTIVNLLN